MFTGAPAFFELAGPFIVICIFTYIIAKEIGDVKKFFLIVLVLEALTFLMFIDLAAGILALAIGAEAI